MRILLLPVFHVLFVLQVRGRDNVPKRSNFLLIANDLNWLTNLF
jgi:1-acyl-sn-glycerol-3-phosphate acyltransferase